MAESLRGLGQEIDLSHISDITTHINTNADLITEMVDALVLHYCNELDTYLSQIDAVLTRADPPVSDLELDEFTLNLPVLLYFTSAAQEELGIKEDVSNAVRLDVYNKIREKAQGTVADKDTAAELASQTETVVLIVYRRAYKKVKLRVEAAYEVLNSVKKVMSRRIAEYEITGRDIGRVR